MRADRLQWAIHTSMSNKSSLVDGQFICVAGLRCTAHGLNCIRPARDHWNMVHWGVCNEHLMVIN